MKRAVLILAALLIIIGTVNQYFERPKPLTTQQFMERDTYLNSRIDSLKTLLIQLQQGQDTIKSDLDTLKQGQRIIFDEVKKASDKSFWTLF
jgi:hypothetical protein